MGKTLYYAVLRFKLFSEPVTPRDTARRPETA